jgi:hypothetical protein
MASFEHQSGRNEEPAHSEDHRHNADGEAAEPAGAGEARTVQVSFRYKDGSAMAGAEEALTALADRATYEAYYADAHGRRGGRRRAGPGPGTGAVCRTKGRAHLLRRR